MVTTTVTVARNERHKAKKGTVGTEQERMMKACTEIANTLIQAYENEADGGKDINLNALRKQVSKKHKIADVPPLTAIIAAIPEHYKKYLMPKLMAKPISRWTTS